MPRTSVYAAAIVLLSMVGMGYAGEGVPDTAERTAIEGTIRAQLAAFGQDDRTAAFAFAAPNVQAKFRDPDTFMSMVRSAYAAVYRPRGLAFGELRLLDGVPLQELLLTGPDGLAYQAIYLMARQPDGSWRIAGVALTRLDGQAS
jgi:hypothetical protein